MGGYTYTTKQGDMWDYIAWKVYEDEYYLTVLLQAPENRSLIDTFIFSDGVEVWCPYVEEEDLETPEWEDDADADTDDLDDEEQDDWDDWSEDE